MGHAQILHPLTQPQQIRHHGAKGGQLLVPPPLLICSNGTHDYASLVDIETCAPLRDNVPSAIPPEVVGNVVYYKI